MKTKWGEYRNSRWLVSRRKNLPIGRGTLASGPAESALEKESWPEAK